MGRIGSNCWHATMTDSFPESNRHTAGPAHRPPPPRRQDGREGVKVWSKGSRTVTARVATCLFRFPIDREGDACAKEKVTLEACLWIHWSWCHVSYFRRKTHNGATVIIASCISSARCWNKFCTWQRLTKQWLHFEHRRKWTVKHQRWGWNNLVAKLFVISPATD